MARTSITPIAAPGSYPNPATPVLITWTAADVANSNQFTPSGKDLILINNTDASSQTVTINSVADSFGRSGDVTAFSMATATYYMFGPIFKTGWMQTGGTVFLQASTATVKFAIIQIPN